MKNTFETMKNGNNAVAVFANAATKEIYPANRNSFGYNAVRVFNDPFWNKYGKSMKTSQGKSDYKKFYYSKKEMESVGFVLVLRGEKPLW